MSTSWQSLAHIDMYHSHTTPGKSQDIMGECCRRGSCIRVVVTILALGLGIDIDDGGSGHQLGRGGCP